MQKLPIYYLQIAFPIFLIFKLLIRLPLFQQNFQITEVKRTAIPGQVIPDIQNHSIIVKYQIKTLYSDKKVKKQSAEKSIHIEEFQQDDIPDIANDLLTQCKLISPQNKDQLILALTSLYEGKIVDSIDGQADINDLSAYLDRLYEDVPSKIQATNQIADLCQNPEYLSTIASNDTIISALAKVLAMDGLLTIQLGSNISQIFYLISHYQTFGETLLAHKVQDSLFRMIEQENKRYQQIFDDVGKIRKQSLLPNATSQQKQNFQKAYENFKQLIAKQDKMLFTALQTVKNLTEIKEANSDEIDLLIPASDLCEILDSVLVRKPINCQLQSAVISYFNKLCLIPGGSEYIRETNLVQSCSSLIGRDTMLDQQLSQLLYNMIFDNILLEQIKQHGITKQIDEQLNSINSEAMQVYNNEYKENDGFKDQVKKIVQNSNKHKFQGTIVQIEKHFATLVTAATQLAAHPQLMQEFISNTNIGTNILLFILICPQPSEPIIQACQLFLQQQELAKKLVKTGLHNMLSQLFKINKNPALLQLYSLVAAQGQPTENAGELIQAALESDDTKLVAAALQTAAQTPVGCLDAETAKKLSAMAIAAIDDENKSTVLASVGVISQQMSKAQNVQEMLEKGQLDGIPAKLIKIIKNNSQEYDLIIVCLVTILKMSTYKVLRKQFCQISDFFDIIVNFLYNIDRNEWDDCYKQMDNKQEGKQDTKQNQNQFVLESKLDSVEKRAMNLFDALSSLILEIYYFTEQEQTEKIKLLKFKKYNQNFFNKYLM